jgi:hypothetical protein
MIYIQRMTAEQAATLKQLARAAYELDAFKPNLTRAEADIRIAMLKAKLKLLDGPPHTLWSSSRVSNLTWSASWCATNLSLLTCRKMAVRPMASPIDGLTKSLNQADLSAKQNAFCVGVRKWSKNEDIPMVTIKYEMHKFGLSVMVNVRVQISTGQYIYPISIADQGSDAANEAQAKRELRKILQGVLQALGE